MIISIVCFSSVEQVVREDFFLFLFITRKSLSFPAVACKSCPSSLQANSGPVVFVYVYTSYLCYFVRLITFSVI